MPDAAHAFGYLRELVWQDFALILAIILGSRLLIAAVRWLIRRAAENGPSSIRLSILNLSPKARVVIEAATIVAIVPILVEPTFHNTIALIATVGIAIAFALKDYISGLVAGLVTILEGTYQPGDWIEVDGAYGEVKFVGVRAAHIVTADDTEVIIPHSKLWSTSVFNATSGNRSLLCVALFYLDADHDGTAVRQALSEIAGSSAYYKPGTKITVIVMEKPWGTLYRLKAYVNESRDQFLFISDLTVRAKAVLRGMNIKFAQAPYAETGKA
jgi:small conductance mechanosensitive channel